MKVRGSLVLCDRCGARYPLSAIPRGGSFRCRNCGKEFQITIIENPPDTSEIRRASLSAGLEPLTESVRTPLVETMPSDSPPEISPFIASALRPPEVGDARERGRPENEVESAPDPPRPEAEEPLFGRYTIEGELGRGEMGVVYQAAERTSGRRVALKTLLPGVCVGREGELRFGREARAIQRLSHPNIVPLLDHGETYDTRFLVSELAEGSSLDRQPASSYADPRLAARLIVTLARALHHAHQQGVLHLDLKPRNVMIAPDGTPRIMDFGLNRAVDTPAEHGFQSPTDEVGGQTLYRAPEQLVPDQGPTDARSDVWALGALLYELLTGIPAFTGGTRRDTVREVLEDDPKPPSAVDAEIDRKLDVITLRALEKRPEDRFPSAAELADDLERFLAKKPISSSPPSSGRRLQRALRRHRRRLRAVALVAIALTVGGGVALWWFRDPMVSIRRQMTARDAAERAAALTRGFVLLDRGGIRADRRIGLVDLAISALADSSDAVRRVALERLMRQPSLVPDDGGERRARFEAALEKCIGERRSPELKETAFQAIELFRARSLTGELAKLTRDPTTPESVVLRAVRTLGAMAGPEAIVDLMRVVGRGGPYRVKGMQGISHIVERNSGDDSPGESSTRGGGGIERGRGARDRGPDRIVKRVLAELNAPATEDPILYTLSNGTTDQRLRVIWILYRTHDPRTPTLLAALFRDDDMVVARAAAALLVESGGPVVERKLEEALLSDSSRVRVNAAFALGELGHPDALDRLLKALFREGDAMVRAEVARALGGVGDRSAVPHLVRVLADADPGVRRAAHEALVRLAGEDVGESPAAWQEWWDSR